MIEHKQGIGKLISDADQQEWSVKYHFRITTDVVETPGLPHVAARSHSIGRVEPIDPRVVLPEGDHALHAEDDEITRVRNLGSGKWVILAS